VFVYINMRSHITMIISPGSDKEPPPVKVRVSNCAEQPCNFVRGKEMIAEVDFIPGE
jgi:hypothetical protein